jgi:glycosyltransferase involved in cell wall biosynthesis
MRVLIINYYWPPSGGPAVQRWLTYTRVLAEQGFEPIVLTVDEAYASFPAIDSSLEKQIHPNVKVYKTPTREFFWIYKKTVGRGTIPSSAFANESNPGPLKRIARFIRGNFFIPDARKGWNKFALAKAKTLIKELDIKLVITAGPPHSSHLMGQALKKDLGITWVADFHDAWTDIIFYKQLYHTKIAAAIDARLERKVLEQADLVLTVGEKYKERLLKKSAALHPEKFHILRMGYDDAVFEHLKTTMREANEPFVFTYTGTISDNYHPEVFFDALKEIWQEDSSLKFVIKMVGVMGENIEKYIIDIGLGDCLIKLGYVPHAQAITALKTADCLLLVNPQVEQEDMVIPGKIYEYLAVGKPIINICSTTAETADIIAQCESGYTFDRTMKASLKEYLYALLKGVSFNPNTEQVRTYGKQQQGLGLAHKLKTMLAY